MIDYTKVPPSKVRQVAYEEGYNKGKAEAIDEFAEKLSSWCCDEGISEAQKVMEMIFYLAERMKNND